MVMMDERPQNLTGVFVFCTCICVPSFKSLEFLVFEKTHFWGFEDL